MLCEALNNTIMEMKNNSYKAVVSAIQETQDGGKLYTSNDWNKFINARIEYNTQGDWTDTERLQSDFEYMIGELTKAKNALKTFNDEHDYKKLS